MSPTETTPSTKREIEVEIPQEEVSRETEVLIQKYQKLARIPGFRRGHVPASIIRQRFSQDIQNDVIDALVPKYFRKETERLGVVPISQPRVTELQSPEGKPLHFKASFEVMPEIKVEGYKELRADHPEISVADDEVEESLKSLQEQKATFSPIEGRAIAEGDYAQVSLAMALLRRKKKEPSPSTWMTYSSKLAARPQCRNLPRTCAGPARARNVPLMFCILKIFLTSGFGARLSATKSKSMRSSRRACPS